MQIKLKTVALAGALMLGPAALAFAGGSAGAQSPTPTPTATPTSTATETVELFRGCNNVTVTWPTGTATSTAAAAITPASGLLSIWQFNNASQKFTAYSPIPNAPNDYTSMSRAQPVFVCMTEPGTMTRPVI